MAKHRQYDPEFRAEACDRLEAGESLTQVSGEMDVPLATLAGWQKRRATEAGAVAPVQHWHWLDQMEDIVKGTDVPGSSDPTVPIGPLQKQPAFYRDDPLPPLPSRTPHRLTAPTPDSTPPDDPVNSPAHYQVGGIGQRGTPMIIATCRTCHQDWMLAQLPAPIIGVFSVTTVIEAPCGHGRFVGHSPALFVVSGAALDPDGIFRWEWRDTAYDAAMRAVAIYDETHPAPREEPWDPPLLSFTCLCGDTVDLAGVDDEDTDEGWRGQCDHCGLTMAVADAGHTVPYAQERKHRAAQARTAWEAARPAVPFPVLVRGLREDAESEEEQ